MAYSRFKLAKTGSMVDDIYLYTEFKENWQYFFTEATMVPDSPGDVSKMVQVKSHTRRVGPGAPAKSVAAHGRFFARSAKTKGSARPGRTYTIIEPAALGGGAVEIRQFSIVGTDMDIQAYAKAKAKFLIHIKGENGWTAKVQGAGGGGGSLAAGQAAVVTP